MSTNHVKTGPIGLDAIIDQVQRKIFELKDVWGVPAVPGSPGTPAIPVELTGYPRCYILQNDETKKTIEAYLEGNDYSGTLIFSEDNKFFFIAPNDIIKESANYYTTEVELFVIVNVKECKPAITTHRADEEVRADVLNVLNRIPAIRVNKIVINIDRVFNRYNSRISQSFEYEYTDDMQPYHCFKIEMTVLPYMLDQTTCN